MRHPVIVAATRTAIGNFNGALSSVSALDLGAAVIREALARAGIDAQTPDEVIMGIILQAGLGQNPARQAAIRAGLPVETPSYSMNKLCGSGLKAVALAAQTIATGNAHCVVAGGMESMSNTPYVLDKVRQGLRMGNATIRDTLIDDGLTDAFYHYHMGMTAENLAEKYSITREEQDAFALCSQERALAAIDSGAFTEEICPVIIKGKKGDTAFATDEFPRRGISAEGLAKLRPAFKKDGTVTAGNASGMNDGAAALVIMSEEAAEQKGLTPLARIVASASAALDPAIMGYAPVPAVQKVLKRAGWKLDDVDYIEANEAFAAQSLSVGKTLGFDHARLTVHGGAIALGHPIGASGARILVTLLHILKQRKARRGLATLCIGGGQGIALLVERP